ncbi:MAG: glycosyltransferase family 4 protein [Lachnospiraceae bacterium]|nr:glycosyltransferase family 4 protein [Lachnospiraceae bacterium]
MARLLFVLDIGFDRGGPSVHLLQDVIRAGLKNGHEIEVILKNTGGPEPEMPNEFIGCKGFSYTAIKEDDEKKHGFAGRYINEIKYANKCAKVFTKRGKYDAVFLQSNTTTYFYMRLLRKLNCRIVYNVQDIFPYNLKLSGQLPLEKITFPVFRKLQHMGYEMADEIITISEDMKRTLTEDGVAESKIKVIYNWSYADTPIRLDDIAPENRFDLGSSPEVFNVVYAGNIGRMQNVEYIVKTALKMHDDPSVHFWIIGDGANKQNVEKMAKDAENVTILPMQPSKYAESIYAQADLNVIPLMPGGIKTALPSKTATVLRVDRPVVFCIDKESHLSELLENDKKALFVDVNDIDSLSRVIRSQQALAEKTEMKGEISSLFSKDNAKTYIDSLIV